jgi:rod shape determining protein RodA
MMLVTNPSRFKPPEGWRTALGRMDRPFLVLALLLFSVGTACVYVASQGMPSFETLWVKHWVALIVALGLACAIAFLPEAALREGSFWLYAFSLALLIAVLAAGRTIHGSRSWFVAGPLQFQPSELAKAAAILFAADLAVRMRRRDPLFLLPAKIRILGVIGVPMVLVLLQHDVSSALSFAWIGLVFVWVLEMARPAWIGAALLWGAVVFACRLAHDLAGLEPAKSGAWGPALRSLGFGPGLGIRAALAWALALAVAAAAGRHLARFLAFLPAARPPARVWLAAGALAAGFLLSWGAGAKLKIYQKNRLVSFVLPRADPLGSGYNALQAKIALGSGRLFGRGVGLGSQTTLGFLPERHTDFAFASLGEATGFLGAMGVVALFGAFLWRLAAFLELARDDFGKLTAAGFFALWLGEASVNLACVLGLFPVLGVGLPFLSYGGSRLLVHGLSIGILLCISRGFYVYR